MFTLLNIINNLSFSSFILLFTLLLILLYIKVSRNIKFCVTSSNPFKLYFGTYSYASDKDGVPDFSARNLLNGIC